MRKLPALFQNGTFSRKKSSRGKSFEFNLTFAGFAGVALLLAFASMREPFMVSRIILFIFACLSAAAPFILFAVAAARKRREDISNAISRERRHDQTRIEIRRTVKAMSGVLSQQRAANDDPEAWTKAVARFANENVFPAISHAVPRSEREMWIMEIRVMADAIAPMVSLREADAGQAPARVALVLSEADLAFVADCAERVMSAGWSAEVSENRVCATVAGSPVLFECFTGDAAVEPGAVEAFRVRLAAEGVERGAIIATQPFSPAALHAARACGMGLIKPVHLPAFLDWAARGSVEPARAAN